MTTRTKMSFRYPTLKAIKADLSAEYWKARREARRCARFIRPRERRLIAIKDGQRADSPDAQEWDGTSRELVEYVMTAEDQGCTEVVIDGGFDGSEDFSFDDYEPCVSDWCVTVAAIN